MMATMKIAIVLAHVAVVLLAGLVLSLSNDLGRVERRLDALEKERRA